MIRLKEVLNAQVQEFRASICSILGFKIDMQPQGKLKLSSIYSSMWTLEFDTHGNFLGFVGASTDRLQEGVVKYLERSHIPAFMAWLTLHLFESSD
jgi:mitotic spindle assembly checkpoint protein MAD1